MAQYDQEISHQEKVRIASDFILHAPPGEFNEVFNDVRALVNNDDLLKEEASGAFAQYNKEQFTACSIPNSTEKVLITEHGDLKGGRFFDPRTKQSFKFDHLRKEAGDFAPYRPDDQSEPLRQAIEKTITNYIHDHYTPGSACTIYGSHGANGIVVIICIEGHKFNPKNYWNGRWRSEWCVTFPSSGGATELKGLLRVQVHYYEDGNVQLVSSREIKETVNAHATDTAKTARELTKVIFESEGEYQTAINENYQTMSDTTFKALRRVLPVTKTKLDWNKLISYRIGQELKNA